MSFGEYWVTVELWMPDDCYNVVMTKDDANLFKKILEQAKTTDISVELHSIG